MEQIGEKDFESKIREAEIAVVDFWATWCRPCKAIEPYLVALGEEYADRGVKVFRINADEDPAVPARFSIFSLPTVLFFKKGKLVDKIVGAQSKAKFVEKVEELLEE